MSDPAAERRTRRGYALCVVAVLVTLAGRALWSSRAELSAGEAALAAGDVSEGIRRLRRAAHWYVPGSPYCARAYERLERVATEAEGQGRAEQALSAWRAIRASALATRWLLVPERDRLERANRHLAGLMAELPPPPEDRAKDRARLREEHLALLREDHAPEPAWLVVLAAGLLTWLGALGLALRDGWDEASRARPRVLVVRLGVAALGLATVLFAVAKA